jgi:hypothetical protein
MASRVVEWHVFTQWYCCPGCRQLWTFLGQDLVALERRTALGPACPSEGVTSQYCVRCEKPHGASVVYRNDRPFTGRGMTQ